MKCTPALLAALGLGSAAAGTRLSAPERKGFHSARRSADGLTGAHSNPLVPGTSNGPSPETSSSQGPPPANQLNSVNWSGEVAVGTGYKHVSGTIVVPKISVPSGQAVNPSATPGYYDGAAWVGIDGDEDSNGCPGGGLLQCGVELTVQNGVAVYYPWWEYWPTYSVQRISEMTISAGDTVRMSVTAYTSTTGNILLENLSKKTHYTLNVTGGSDVPLCFKSAEWIVEDIGWGSGYAPFPNFTGIAFTNISTNLGIPSSPELWYMAQNNQVLSQCTIPSGKAGAGPSCVYG